MSRFRWIRYGLIYGLALLCLSGCHWIEPSSRLIVKASPPIVKPDLLRGQGLVPVAQPGPWQDLTGLIGYGDRLWFANSVAFGNHNSADVYSYDPATGKTRYERHLFSQSVGQPTVADGLLYWPFEDPRFSADRGEYMVTNGEDWQWHLLPDGEAFHVHAMAAKGEVLYAGTGAWAGGLQRSTNGGTRWELLYEYPTPPRQVSRITALASFRNELYVGVTALHERSTKLFRWQEGELEAIANWPKGKYVEALTAYGGWLYAVNFGSNDELSVWRTQGANAQQLTGLDGYRIRALAAGRNELWAVSSSRTAGLLWRSEDGLSWEVAHQFEAQRPLDVLVYGGQVYVGAQDLATGRGVLLGPEVGAAAVLEQVMSPRSLPSQALPLQGEALGEVLAEVDGAIGNPSTYSRGDSQDVLATVLKPFALSQTATVGEVLSQRLNASLPQDMAQLFEGKVTEPARDVLQWYLLWAMGLNGQGQVPPELLGVPWTTPQNDREKYWQSAPASAWTMAQVGQSDRETIAALINRLSFEEDPLWLKGDVVGALTVLTQESFGYDEAAWQDWWAEQDGVGFE